MYEINLMNHSSNVFCSQNDCLIKLFLEFDKLVADLKQKRNEAAEKLEIFTNAGDGIYVFTSSLITRSIPSVQWIITITVDIIEFSSANGIQERFFKIKHDGYHNCS